MSELKCERMFCGLDEREGNEDAAEDESCFFRKHCGALLVVVVSAQYVLCDAVRVIRLHDLRLLMLMSYIYQKNR